MGGKGSGHYSNVKDWELIDFYQRLGSLRKVAKFFGISYQAVYERLKKYPGVVRGREINGEKRKAWIKRQFHRKEALKQMGYKDALEQMGFKDA